VSDPTWCDKCFGPRIPFTMAEWCWSWVCWFVVLRWPDRWFMNRVHAAILPWAGSIAYRCTCTRTSTEERANDCR
jgi:CBS domain containing-hemolysin-like protein